MKTTYLPTPVSECPEWCSGGHLPAEGGVVHISVEETVAVDSDGEAHTLYISLEQADTITAQSPVGVRIEGGTSAPMSPLQAMQLAAVLQRAAFAAVSGGWAVQR